MANLSKTRAPFAFTSPRSILKIVPEIRILVDHFAGDKWTPELQHKYFDTLFKSEFYLGKTYPKHPGFAGRDRITRAPKALGFVNLDPVIALTQVGEHLLYGSRPNETIARQLFKFQLPSPYHKIAADRGFNVRPYLEILRLVKTLGKVSKIEIALFFPLMNTYKRFDEVVGRITDFRNPKNREGKNFKTYINKCFEDVIQEVYAEEIEQKKFHTRENPERSYEKFINTKKSNHTDYADAFLRYLRATELVSFQRQGFIVEINSFYSEYVDLILSRTPREVLKFASEMEFKKYLFDPYSVWMPFDDRDSILSKLAEAGVWIEEEFSLEELKAILDERQRQVKQDKIQETAEALRDYSDFDDIADIFQNIKKTPDPSLFLEWNTWRALAMMNYAVSVQGNFSVDVNGEPLSTAGGNMPDIEVDYNEFKLIVEVTLSSGQKQYEMEGEPVPRHLGRVRQNSEVPVYCLFIAPKVSTGTLAHFYNLNRFNTTAYGGKTAILPMSIDHFVEFVTVARDTKFSDPAILRRFFDDHMTVNQNPEITEDVWFERVVRSVGNWTA